MIIDDFSKPKLTVVEGSAANDYFKRRKDEEDRIAGTKPPAKRTPKQTDYEKKRKQQDVAEEVESTVAENYETFKKSVADSRAENNKRFRELVALRAKKDATKKEEPKKQDVAEGSLNEFAQGNGGSDNGNYLKELARAWYTIDLSVLGHVVKQGKHALDHIIDVQESVERLLQRGIHCPDGKVRKYEIGYNSAFNGVEMQSHDHYEHSDTDDNGNDIDDRTGQPWGPYDVLEFSGRELRELNESANPVVAESNRLMNKLHQALLQEGRVKELADDLKTLNDAEFIKKYGKAKAAIRRDMKKLDEQGVAEMDSQSPKGRMKSDGTRSHSTYGSRDHYSDSDPQHTAKPTTAKKTTKQATDIFNKAFKDVDKKKGVAEGSVGSDPYQDYREKKIAQRIAKGVQQGDARRFDADLIRGTSNIAKSAYFPEPKPMVKKLEKPLDEQGVAEGLTENAQDLHIGDPVIITGNGIEFEGATGEIIDFGSDHRFVVVNLYNHGRHSFHSSDVSFNEYAGSDDEEARAYDAGEFGDDPRDMYEARMSAARRMANAVDKQRAKSNASLARTPGSIPVDKERMIRDIATSNASPEHKKVAIDAVMKTMSEHRVKRQALMAQMLNSR
jgi:hypothetical protein